MYRVEVYLTMSMKRCESSTDDLSVMNMGNAWHEAWVGKTCFTANCIIVHLCFVSACITVLSYL